MSSTQNSQINGRKLETTKISSPFASDFITDLLSSTKFSSISEMEALDEVRVGEPTVWLRFRILNLLSIFDFV